MKRYDLIVLMLLLCSCSVFALEGFTTLNLSVENVSDTARLNVTLIENASLYITPMSLNSRLNYSYQTVLNFTNATMELNFTVFPNYVFTSNETINSTFNLSNSVNNNTYLYSLITYVLPEVYFNESREEFIDVVNGDYVINISTNLIPKTGSLSYRIQGLSGETLNISCAGSWLSCPTNTIFASDNSTEFSINYSIPVDAPLGATSFVLDLRTGNISLSRNITFNIYEPDLILQQYVFDDSCFTTDANGDLTLTYECLLDYQEFQYQQNIQLINRLREERNISCPATINNTELRYYGNVEQEVLDQLDIARGDRDVCRDDYNQMQSRINDKDTSLNTCNSQLKEAERKLLNNETTCLQTVFATSVKLKQDAEDFKEQAMNDAKKHRRNTIWIVVGIIAFVLAVLGLIIWRNSVKKEAWSL